MKRKQQELGIFWKIGSSCLFLLLLHILLISLAIFLVRYTVSIYKINSGLEAIAAIIIFPAAGVLKLIRIFKIEPTCLALEFLVMITPIIYYPMLILVPIIRPKKYLKPLILLLLIWSIVNVIGMPDLASSLSSD